MDYEITSDYGLTSEYDTTGYDWNEVENPYESYTRVDDDFDSAVFAVIFAIWGIILVVGLIALTVRIISLWKIFLKAGKNGWEAIIPVYNSWVMYEVVGFPGWFVFLGFIPFVGGIIMFVFSILTAIRLTKAFGKSDGFAVGLILLPIVFYPILAFDSSTYSVPEQW